MLTRLMFSGGKTSIATLILKAVQWKGDDSKSYIGFNSSNGTLNPAVFYYRGDKYTITVFLNANTAIRSTLEILKNNMIAQVTSIEIEINGKPHTFNREASSVRLLYSRTWLFSSAGTYTIKILSIK